MGRRIAVLIVALLLIICSSAWAHSGRTDSQGGHYNHSTGEYHFHHGYPEHQHPGGVCPYATSAKATAKPSKSTSYSNPSYAQSETVLDHVAIPSQQGAKSMDAGTSVILALTASALIFFFAWVITLAKAANSSKKLRKAKSELSEVYLELEKQTASVTRLSHILQGKETIIAMTRKQSDAYRNSIIELEDDLRKTRSQLKETSSAHEELVSIWEDHLLSNDPFRNLHYEARVYVRREGASKYHTTIHCGTHGSYKLIPLRNAMEKGYSPCLQCFTSMPKEHIVSQYKTNK